MYKLIIIDDEKEIREGLKNFFPWATLDFEVIDSFSNGRNALDFIAENPVDIVLTDIRMPFMTGIQLAEILSIDYPNIKIIFLSGHRDFDYAQQAIRYGVIHYITKPTKYNELFEIFENLRNELTSTSETLFDNNYYMRIIKKVSIYMDKNIATANLNDAAQLINLTPSYLSKIFREYSPKSFSETLLEKKIEYAKVLLSTTDQLTYEISENLGYNNPKNFSRAFKRFTNLSPREYKNIKGRSI
jgi:YesN/AraC family two-component response regulator